MHGVQTLLFRRAPPTAPPHTLGDVPYCATRPAARKRSGSHPTTKAPRHNSREVPALSLRMGPRGVERRIDRSNRNELLCSWAHLYVTSVTCVKFGRRMDPDAEALAAAATGAAGTAINVSAGSAVTGVSNRSPCPEVGDSNPDGDAAATVAVAGMSAQGSLQRGAAGFTRAAISTAEGRPPGSPVKARCISITLTSIALRQCGVQPRHGVYSKQGKQRGEQVRTGVGGGGSGGTGN